MNRLAALGLFALLAIAHTWPLAGDPAAHSRVDNGDYSLNVWAVDWVARTLPANPAHLFDANIFHPARLTLAYSEPLILQGALAIPAVWLGAPPVLTYNVLTMAGLALSGWAFALLVYRETRSWPAALVAGSAVAFNAHHLMRLVHIQALHLELLPLVFLAMDRLLATGRARYAAMLGAAVAVQATASIYLLVFTGGAAACAWMARAARVARPAAGVRGVDCSCRRHLRGAAAAGAVAVCGAGADAGPGARARRNAGVRGDVDRLLLHRVAAALRCVELPVQGQLGRQLPRPGRGGAGGRGPGLRLETRAARADVAGRRRWIGAALGAAADAGLCVAARARAGAWRDPLLLARRADGAGRHGRAGGVRRCGTPGAWGCGGVGAWGRGGEGRALAVVLVAAVNLEALRAPLWYRDYPGVPAIYGTLRDQPGAVIELPFYGRGGFFGNAGYMINATRHRRPLVNGYSGFAPPGFEATAQMMRAFPREDALRLLETLGVTHVVVHRATAPMQRRRALIDASPRLQLVAEQDGIAIYQIVRDGRV